jgi:hypothetical protein
MPPFVVRTSPTAQVFDAPANVVFSVDANSMTSTIKDVKFYSRSELVATVAAPPYTTTLPNLSAGYYNLVAMATDNQGASGSTTVMIQVVGANSLPTVSMTAPANGQTLTAPANITLAASASDTDGTISQLEFLQGAAVLGTGNVPPYRMDLSNVPAGSYQFSARATDNRGGVSTSAATAVTVNAPFAAPAVAILEPAVNATFTSPATIDLSASASADTGASITKVEYFNGATLIGSATVAPFRFSWLNVSRGSYQVTAKATDSRGLTATSPGRSIAVAAAPLSVQIATPAANATCFSPCSLNILANIWSEASTIVKVEFFDGATSLYAFQPETATNGGPYGYAWSPALGDHTITVKTTDSLNATVTSSAVTLKVLAAPKIEFGVTGRLHIAPAYIEYRANAVPEGNGRIDRVEFYNGSTLIGTVDKAPFNFTWPAVPVGSYALSAKAIDSAGGTATAASVNVEVRAAPSIALAAGLDGSAVNDDRITLNGSVSAAINSGVSVGGRPASLAPDGTFVINDVPLRPGTNQLTLNVLDIGGAKAAQTFTVTSAGKAPFTFVPTETEFIGEARVNFALINRGKVAVGRVELRCVEGGAISVDSPDIADLKLATCVYLSPGIHKAVARVYDSSNVLVYTGMQQIHVLAVQDAVARMRSAYVGMTARLKNGNAASALNMFSEGSRELYADIFSKLDGDLQNAAAGLGEISKLNIASELGELVLLRETPTGRRAFLVQMIRGDDGIWRIESM